MDRQDLAKLISDLRAEIAENTVSPESVGYLIQSVLDIVPDLDPDALLSDISAAKTTASDALTKADTAVSTAESALAKSSLCLVTSFTSISAIAADKIINKTYTPIQGESSTFVFSSKTNTFVLMVSTSPTASVYYADWDSSLLFGEATATGVTPISGKMYMCTSTMELLIGTVDGLTRPTPKLGNTADSAYSGEKGNALENKLSICSHIYNLNDLVQEPALSDAWYDLEDIFRAHLDGYISAGDMVCWADNNGSWQLWQYRNPSSAEIEDIIDDSNWLQII
jgi:hypothetical protein